MNKERISYMVFGAAIALAGFVVGTTGLTRNAYAVSDGGMSDPSVAGVSIGPGKAAFVAVMADGTVKKITYATTGVKTGWQEK